MKPTHELIDAMIASGDCPPGVLEDALKDMRPGWEEGMDKIKVYIVSGETGEYSDRSQWMVAAFLDEAKAVAFCVALNEWCKKENVHSATSPRPIRYNQNPRLVCPLDPRFSFDYTGTEYSVLSVELRA